ncbi:uncharacterized protein LOC131061909 isoform X2 [Cryptomeria japonica]|uniref:uncharacterized protein LOC131061909 isoform X2 n=1 Tax=Cryptomeria japonica TaxID=3369 RepID=UPI0025ABA9B9|nr:uncharacterized protein LOC131061909 isoform X2 [Cryptomeria japonica]
MNRKPGDWNCSSCQHLNFSRRDSCQKCGDPRPGGSRGDERSEYGSFSRGGGGGGGGGGGSYGYGGGGGGGYGGGSDVRPGDWYCSAGGCGAHNFASRSSCFKCGSGKEESGGGGGSGFESSGGRGGSRGGGFGFGSSYNAGSGGRSGWKSGDWICGRSGCNEHNFASRMECFRCSAPRESGTAV